MKRLVFVLACSVAVVAFAKETPKFPVSAIPEELKKDVNAVYREDQSVFSIISRSRASHYVYQVITILNSNANSYASDAVGYDKLTKINTLKVTVYDAEGFVVSRLKNSEIADRSVFDGFTLFSDDRMKTFDVSQGSYPYTVEIEYELEYKFLFYIPPFWVQNDDKTSVEHSLYRLKYAPGLEPRYKTYHIDTAPSIEKAADGSGTITFEHKNVRPIRIEPLSKRQGQLPSIEAAPTNFEYENYVGVMDTWSNYGLWINSLIKGRDALPDATRQKIKSLTAQAKTDEEKIKILYEYLQSRTRYVGIQVGIGGHQPFEATVVDQNGYGDCKALSNYMIAMLKEIGIKGYYTLIDAGNSPREIDPKFPRVQFNHAIVCVPQKIDTIWLECTNQTNPFGYQGRFTGDRKALVITDNGAKVVNTIRYPAEKNLQSRTADVFLQPNGDASAKIKTSYSGLQYENGNLDGILTSQFDEQKKWLQGEIDIPSFDITTFKMENHKSKIPSAQVAVDLTLKRFATLSGKRVFVTPNLMNRSSYVPEKVESRKTKVLLNMGFTDFDTIRYHLPEGIYPEFIPKPILLKSRFGEYEATFTLDQNDLIYIRRFKLQRGEYPSESYSELIDFYKGLNKADNTKLVFLSKT
ncbi:DUF3857 domain-containing transglutaminase family protein [Chryseolinea soli]|uniref:DUF3857 domain-containing protein n=1 Tax=Chryseolinea soli TaxID=2321403 RepID=A0A385SKX8_9BACT|nr:DUF3857 and transglutaminase domain-containing protein [Chryseolinea soli]AYB30585.1 DUF3857 domain-containing protein [Chryseolinea soli]